MSEMHERVTKAILGAFTHIPDKDYRNIIAGCWARAAMEAMREPTYDMKFADAVREWPEDAAACWRAMIDQALVELGPLRPAGSADLHGVPRAEE